MRILLVIYDNASYISEFPLGLGYIASVWRKAGHEVVVYNQDVYHWPDEHLTAFLDAGEPFDIVAVSVIAGYYQYRKLIGLSKAINAAKQRPFYVIGGHGPAPEPEYFLTLSGAECAVIGEGEITSLELIEAIRGERAFADVDGIAYMEDGECKQTPRRRLIPNIDDIDMPAYDLFPMEHYALMRMPNIRSDERCVPILSGRGCIFKCNFCFRLDKGFRPRSAESILEEIKLLQRNYGVTYIAFYDELLMSSEKRTGELCEAFLSSGIKFRWWCQGRLNFASKPVLKLMKKAGCVFVNYGIESMDPKALEVMNKQLTVEQVITGVENTLEVGISPGLNIIFGNIGETLWSLEQGVQFLLKYADHSQLRTIRPVTPYPGSPLYYHALENGLLKDVREFYEERHLNSDLLAVNFTDLSDDEVYAALLDANTRLIQRHYDLQRAGAVEAARKLYVERNVKFRGFRHT